MTTAPEPGDWRPANPVEQAMVEALAERDGPGYARLLRSARLLIPDLPPGDSPVVAALALRLPAGGRYRPVFTSREALAWALGGPAPACEEVDFPALLQRWPDPSVQLAVNPGSPIAMVMPPPALAELAEGRRSLVPTADVREALVSQIRHGCLQQLAGPAYVDGAGPLRDDPPANPLEVALRDAVTAGDAHAYLRALLSARTVVLPTAAPVTDPDQILDGDFPWRVLGGDQLRAIPVFSSTAMLERTGAGGSPRVEIGMLPLVAAWPGEEFLLYVNPGSVLELILSGDGVLELVELAGE